MLVQVETSPARAATQASRRQGTMGSEELEKGLEPSTTCLQEGCMYLSDQHG